MHKSNGVLIAGRQAVLNKIEGGEGASIIEENLLISVKAHSQT